jgi:hypothetical protein
MNVLLAITESKSQSDHYEMVCSIIIHENSKTDQSPKNGINQFSKYRRKAILWIIIRKSSFK